MTNTKYNPRLLEQWSIDVNDINDIQELDELLQSYLHRHDTLLVSKKQRNHVKKGNKKPQVSKRTTEKESTIRLRSIGRSLRYL